MCVCVCVCVCVTQMIAGKFVVLLTKPRPVLRLACIGSCDYFYLEYIAFPYFFVFIVCLKMLKAALSSLLYTISPPVAVAHSCLGPSFSVPPALKEGPTVTLCFFCAFLLVRRWSPTFRQLTFLSPLLPSSHNLFLP